MATSAVREAENRGEFLDRACDEAGVSVEVISGFEEARLIHLGRPPGAARLRRPSCCSSTSAAARPRSCSASAATSSPAAASSWGPSGSPGGSCAKERGQGQAPSTRARQPRRDDPRPLGAEVADAGYDTVVGASGTIETVVAMALAATATTAGCARCNGAAHLRRRGHRRGRAAGCRHPMRTSAPRSRAWTPSGPTSSSAGPSSWSSSCAPAASRSSCSPTTRSGRACCSTRPAAGRGRRLHHLRDLRRRSVLHLVELTDEHPEHSEEIARHALDLLRRPPPSCSASTTRPASCSRPRRCCATWGLHLALRAPQAQLLRDPELASTWPASPTGRSS